MQNLWECRLIVTFASEQHKLAIMDKTLRNTFIGAFIGVLATIVVASIGAWIDINSRISILEVDVANNHEQIATNSKNMEDIKTMLQDIQVGVQHLQDVKADK